MALEEHLRTAFLDPVKTAMMDGLTDGLAALGAGVLLLRDDPDAGPAPRRSRPRRSTRRC